MIRIISRIYALEIRFENQIWRIKTKEELDKLIKHRNIVNYIKPQRLSTYKECQTPEEPKRYSNGIP
jgi:hypothetical protein